MTSVSRPRIKTMVKDGVPRASRVMRFIENFDHTLSTILVGNNLVNILASSLCTVLFTMWFGVGGVGWATLAMTVFILLVGEITPKSLAKDRPERVALFVTPLLSAFDFLLWPVTWVFGLWRKLLNRIIRRDNAPSITGDELSVLVEESEKEGTLGQNESELIQSAIEFDEIAVKEILTPRVDAVMAEDTDSADELMKMFSTSHHSRIPVYRETVDNVIGIVHEKEFWPAYVENPSLRIETLARKALFVPDSLKISVLLARLRREKTHMAIVIDQYGGVMGIVTMEDVLEELVGEIYDESDVVTPPIQRTGEDTWQVEGSASITDVFEAIGLTYEADEFESTSIGGLATELAGRLPSEGDSFTWKELGITVLKVAERRVERLELTRLEPVLSEPEDEI